MPDEAKTIGTVTSVSSSSVSAVMSGGTNGQQEIANQSGRIGMFVTIPDGKYTVVGMVSSVRTDVNRAAKGTEQLTSGHRIMDIQLIGTVHDGAFTRGLSSYPLIGAPVMGADPASLKSIFSAYRSMDFSFGMLPQIDKERLYLDPNKFFSKHIALFGSTGSGKSCTAASILQKVTSLENTHVVLLDLHGEYAPAFTETGNLINITDIELPYWLMNFDELVETLIDETEISATNQMMVMKEAILDSKRGKNLTLKDYLTVDTPVFFDFLDVSARMRSLDTERTLSGKEGPFYGQFTRFLVRLESKLTDKRYEFLFKPKNYRSSDTFASLLTRLFALDSNKRVTIIDLSRVPFDVINVLVSLLGRIIYDFNVWNEARQDFPILVVFEEAHAYLSMSGRSHAARKTVERIAKEGRKYGVSCMIISQRPAEISETITAQCNNFIAMRILNPNDQAYVRKLLPDALSNLMDVLPTLQQGEAYIIGDAVPMPSRIIIDIPSPRPSSGDVKFYERWQTKQVETNVHNVVDKWWKQERS
jgi:DNA helicase HerA-like ATPase